jgi:signal peptidase
VRYTNEAIKRRKRAENILKRKINILIYIILIPILIYNISLIIQAVIKTSETPNFLGIKTYVIISGSMEPNLQIGDIVIVKKVAQNELKQGDIISYRQGQSVITHRIAEVIDKEGEVEYKTKGDNNNAEDSGIISYEMIEGKVVKHISQIGKIAIILQKKGTIIFIILILYIYILYSSSIKKKRALRKLKREEFESKRLEKEYEQKK